MCLVAAIRLCPHSERPFTHCCVGDQQSTLYIFVYFGRMSFVKSPQPAQTHSPAGECGSFLTRGLCVADGQRLWPFGLRYLLSVCVSEWIGASIGVEKFLMGLSVMSCHTHTRLPRRRHPKNKREREKNNYKVT